MEHIQLIGSEEVQRAVGTFRSAVDDFGRHVAEMAEEQYRHQQFLDGWLMRFSEALKALPGEADHA